MAHDTWMHLVVFVPETHLESLKNRLFDAGAGRIGDYERCCWQVLGQGQFMPMTGSNPTIGTHHQETQVAEYRLECLCMAEHQMAITTALHTHHPYETPAFYWTKVQTEMEPIECKKRR